MESTKDLSGLFSRSQKWPLAPEGALPELVFGGAHLKDLFISCLPTALGMPWSEIRHLLKVLIKRESASLWDSHQDDDGDRAGWIIDVVCNTPSLRRQLAGLKLGISKWRKRGVLKREPDRNDLTHILWRSYQKCESVKSLVQRLERLLVQHPTLPQGLYLTAEVVKSENFVASIGDDLATVEFARLVVIFASLLPRAEMIDLLTVACEAGCELLEAAFDMSEELEMPSFASEPNPRSPVAVHIELRPITKAPLEASNDASRLIKEFWTADVDARAKRSAVETALSSTPIAVLITSTKSKLDAFVSNLEAARRSHEAADGLRDRVNARIELSLEAISSCAGYKISFRNDAASHWDTIIQRYVAVDALNALFCEYGFPHALREKYRRFSHKGFGQEELEQLFYQVSHHREWQRVSSEYTAEFLRAKQGVVGREGADLESARGDELAALANSCVGPEWILPRAIGVRAALDAGPGDANGHVAALLCESQSTDYCRSLLYFFQADQIAQLKGVHAKRIGALEYIRDALEFGPVARLSEPHPWLRDTDVVGRNAVEALEIIVNNSDLLTDAPTIARLLRPAGSKQAARALNAFVSTPIGMQGNFKRLREIARDRYLLPLVERDSHKVEEISALIEELEQDAVADDIYAEVAVHRSGELESRHMEQLKRYLSRASSHLKDYKLELLGRADGREVALRAELSRAHDKLAKTADAGGVSWFESELRKILSGTSAPPSFPAFQGLSTSLLKTEWDRSHNDWAMQSLDLPELHMSLPVRVSDVMYAALKCMVANKKPSPGDVIEALIFAGDLTSALAYARLDTSEFLEQIVRDAASPQTKRLELKMIELTGTFGQAAVDSSPEARIFEGHLRNLEIPQAEGALELLELALIERRNAVEESELDRLRILDLLARISECGASYVGTNDVPSLHAAWTQLLAHRESERAHLQCLLPAVRAVEQNLPELASEAADFRIKVEQPRFWLPADSSADFALFIEECGTRIGRWADSASLLKQEERHALSVLTEWYLRFISELVEGLAQSVEPSSIASALGRAMEVADSISTAGSPYASLLQLKEIGEIEGINGRYIAEKNVSARLPEYTQCGSILPDVIARHVTDLDWVTVAELCLQWGERLQPEDANTLHLLASACNVFGGGQREITQEHVEAAVGFLVSRTSSAAGLTEHQRTLLAKTVLTSAVLVESSGDITRENMDWSWGQVLSSKGSPLRKGASVDGFSSRVLSELLLGFSSGSFAHAVWDGLSGLQDPAQFRTSLLLKLYELELSDLIGRLAARQEPGILQKLNHLFELRSVASTRPDLVAVSVGVADQIANSTKNAPLKAFLKALPVASQVQMPELQVKPLSDLSLRGQRDKSTEANLTVVVSPVGLVPEKIEALLLTDDDVSFASGGVRKELSSRPIYFPTEFILSLQLGPSWASSRLSERPVRVRIRARTITGELCQGDMEVIVRLQPREQESAGRLDDETLLDAYPGVSNTPAVEGAFVGRIDELELLHKLLVSARRPSPVLMVGLRRIGKTSLLFALHHRHRSFTTPSAVTFYLSLAERRVELVGARRSVSAVVFGAIVHALVRQNLSFNDHNYVLCSKVRDFFSNDARAAREDLQRCFDEESLADSLSALRERLATCVGNPSLRLVIMIDEAEALVASYAAGGGKRLELEQFLQSIRELSQSDENLAFLLAGSNHISVFSREYKNAFFGSSQIIELAGLKRDNAPALVSPVRITPFISFDKDAVEYAYDICGGMPQFLWQVGATVSHIVRSGNATRNEVRRAVAILTSHESASLPFKSYEILEPIDSVIGLEEERERDLLWMLLYRIAQSSSLIVEEAATAFVIDQTLLQLDDREAWKKRIAKLAELGVIKIPSSSTVAFLVPIFAEGFRSARNWQEYNIRQQKVIK
ncbi:MULTISPECIES: hypothetical protein [unclassified Xanthomonas]|uniref:hypothetical protein n=1 Tax=unclassified Xanthomonas TaxID=2643310 RepID=UPI002A841BA1|nr:MULTISPECIES: hypothetical protein [unclassified Xanthomonas]MDY4296319.1 hypothetical protein [Xanthomonas sp. LF02-5]MDY4358007.1 hypothetical protein [Xanthomonas sp. LF04-12]